ncbi:MAG: GTP-binding protein [Candidatus Woesearchaeota archaeon]
MGVFDERIKELEEEISKTKYNKRTQHHIGLVKAKLAKLQEKKEARESSKGKIRGYEVKKTGDGTVVLLGYPSVGKSTLLNSLTNAESKTAPYAFTTISVVPGILIYNGAKIQILDIPGIVKGASKGTGKGREALSILRSADLILILVDVNYPEHLEILKKELFDSKIRINQKKPDVKIVKKTKDGISLSITKKLTKIDTETLKDVLREFGYVNADVVIREDIDIDQLIDIIENNRKYVPSIIVINKIDTVNSDKGKEVIKKLNADIAISAEKKINIDELKELIFSKLNILRIYMKEPGKEPDLEIPLIMFNGCTIQDVCNKLHKDFVRRFKFARVWGASSKFPGQKLQLNHKLADKDILELHLN